MMGGNIQGVMRVVSVSIYDHVAAGEHVAAHWLASGTVLFSFLVILALNWSGAIRHAPSWLSTTVWMPSPALRFDSAPELLVDRGA